MMMKPTGVEVPARRRHYMSALPLIIMSVVGLSIWLWPPSGPDAADFSRTVRPPVAEAGIPVPTTILSVDRQQSVGGEAYWKGFRLNSGWQLAPVGDYGRFGLMAKVTNEMDVPDTARVIVTVRVGERNTMFACHADLDAGETRPLICSDNDRMQYNSRWSRITLSVI